MGYCYSRSTAGYIIPILFAVFLFVPGCGSNSTGDSTGRDETPETTYTITADPSHTYQEMIGFGGSLTWYSDRITADTQTKEEIGKLLFEDLGIDILRLKNWYYPSGYPDNTSPEAISGGNRTLFETTNEFYDLAKQHNPDIKILLSSWGPPPALKSNNKLNEGTLKKKANGDFMYEAFARYWMDILNHITFNPDYLSIQNEPDYVNPGWETCEWRPTETADFPSYETAMDVVHDSLQKLNNPPILVGPEAANLSQGSFPAFADVLRDKDYVGMYAYHTYNFSGNTGIEETSSHLQAIRANFSDKPNIMTEYSGMTWMKTARFINKVLVEANASGYIYWDMVWGEEDSNANPMIKIDPQGNYALTPFFYVIMHYAKYIEEGYRRIEVSSDNSALEVSGFVNPGGDRVTLVIVNPFDVSALIDFKIVGKTADDIRIIDSRESSFFNNREGATVNETQTLKGSSITTVILNI